MICQTPTDLRGRLIGTSGDLPRCAKLTVSLAAGPRQSARLRAQAVQVSLPACSFDHPANLVQSVLRCGRQLAYTLNDRSKSKAVFTNDSDRPAPDSDRCPSLQFELNQFDLILNVRCGSKPDVRRTPLGLRCGKTQTGSGDDSQADKYTLDVPVSNHKFPGDWFLEPILKTECWRFGRGGYIVGFTTSPPSAASPQVDMPASQLNPMCALAECASRNNRSSGYLV